MAKCLTLTPATPAIPVKAKSPLPHKTIGLGHVPVSDKRKSLDNERISPKTEKSKIQSKIDSMFDISDTDSPPPPTPKKQPETSAFSLGLSILRFTKNSFLRSLLEH